MDRRKRVAALVTEYRKWSHAELLVGKIVEGYHHDGKEGPDLRLASLYVDQFPPNDTSRALAKRYGFPIYDSPAAALTCGGKELAVDGVLIVGEHGKYPKNARGQILYPRRQWFEETVKVFERSKRAVPVFNDKHLACTWADARWMADKARELKFPLLAGSTIPLTWRRPELTLPRGCELTAAVSISYGPVEGYGFHALEGLQCMAERRKGGETGVAAVQALRGEAMWKALDDGQWSKDVFDAALKLVPAHARGDIRELTVKDPTAVLWLIEYRDGLKAAVPNLNGWIYEGEGGPFIFAGRLKGKAPVATQFYQQQPDPFAHFSYQVRAFETMVRTGASPIPLERTLLTTGVLEAAMISAAEGHRRVPTPYLDVAYQPTDWPHATGPIPKAIKR